MTEKFEDPIGKEFEMPKALLDSISECAPEGFIMFYVDNTGTPQVRASFGYQITEMGLRSYASKFLDGINKLEESGIAETLHQENEDGEDDFSE